MPVGTYVPVELYVATSYPDHDREYNHGEVEERGMPTYIHGKLQGLLFSYFWALRDSQKLYPAQELRLQLLPDLIRIPDVCVFAGEEPANYGLISTVPLVVIEIPSPDDRHSAMLLKCAEYEKWGVQYIYVVDPQRRMFSLYEAGGLRPVDEISLAGYPVSLRAESLFTQANI